jgi:carboxypeptidase family protein
MNRLVQLSAIAVLLLRGTVPAIAQAPPVEPGNWCSVEGQVVDAVTNAPIRKALLTLIRKTQTKPEFRTTAPDSGGRFRFSNIPPGDYTLSGAARGYLLLAEHTARQPRRAGTVFSLSAGQTMSGIILRLRAFAAVSGRIVDEDGDPLAGMQVQLLHVTYRSGRRELQLLADYGRDARTDDRGIYRIAGITPGKYYLSASPSEQMPNLPLEDARYLRTYYPGTLDPNTAAPIQLAAGGELENISLKLSKVHTVRVSGRVLSAVPASVNLDAESIVYTHQGTESVLPDGKFEFAGVAPGAYRLIVRVRQGEQRAWAYRSLSVGATGVDGLTLSPIPGAIITGRLRLEGEGKAVNFSKIAIQLMPVSSTGVSYAEMVGQDGRFRIDDIVPGRYRVVYTSAEPPAGVYLKAVRSAAGHLPGYVVDVSSGSTEIEGLLSPKAATVGGTVFAAGSDIPAPEATVVLIPQEKERRDDLHAYLKSTTDASGKFTIRNVPPGEYRAFAFEWLEYDNIYLDPDFMRPLEGAGAAVALEENALADLKVTLIPDDSR